MTTLTLVLRIVFVVSTSIALLSAARQDYHYGLVRRLTFVRAAACQIVASVTVVAGVWFMSWHGLKRLGLNLPVLKWLGLDWPVLTSSDFMRGDLDSSSLTSPMPSPLQISTPIVTRIITALSVGLGICALGFLFHRLTRIRGKRRGPTTVHHVHTRVLPKFSVRVVARDPAQPPASSPTELARQLPSQSPPQSGIGLADVWAAGLTAQTLALLWPVTDALLLWCLLWLATSVHALVSHMREEGKPQRKEGGARQLRLLPHLLWTWSVLIPTLLLIHPP